MVSKYRIMVTILGILVVFLGNISMAELSCKATFKTAFYNKNSYHSAGTVIAEDKLDALRGLSDGEYNFLVLNDGFVSIGPKYQVKEGVDKSVISHQSLLNKYSEVMKDSDRIVSDIDISGSIKIVNRVVAEVNGRSQRTNDMYLVHLLAFVKRLKDNGLKITELTKVKRQKLEDNTDIRDDEIIGILRRINENSDLSLLFMSIKRLNKALYDLFPSRSEPGLVDVQQVMSSAKLVVNSSHSAQVLKSLEKFINSINSRGVLLTTHQYLTTGRSVLKNEHPDEKVDELVVARFNKFYQLALSLAKLSFDAKNK